MYVTPIRSDLLRTANQISCLKGKWYVRRFDPDTVQNGHVNLFFYERGGRIYFDVFSSQESKFN